MRKTLRKQQIQRTVLSKGADVLASENHKGTEKYIQHGDVSVREHTISVACMCVSIAQKLHLNLDYYALVRGALLHDYFLYDWHDKSAAPNHHTFTHPKIALANAERDFALNDKERDIIRKHMFPLCFPFPKYKESWLITLADKTCAASEIWHLWSLENVIAALDSRIKALCD